MGTTVRVASIREDGHTFHDKRTPAKSQTSPLTLIIGGISHLAKLTVPLLHILETLHFGGIRWMSDIRMLCLIRSKATITKMALCGVKIGKEQVEVTRRQKSVGRIWNLWHCPLRDIS
jgi:hypothetical protein